MYSLRFGRLSRGWVFMGFYSVTSAVHVLLVEFCVFHADRLVRVMMLALSCCRVMGTAVLSCSIPEDDNKCISNSSSSLCQKRRVHQVSLGERVQTGTDPCVTC